jgi:hypothetical protein
MSKITITERRCKRCGKIGTTPWPGGTCPACVAWKKESPTKRVQVRK